MPPLNLSTLTDLRVRAYLYRVLLAAGAVLTVYGVVTEQQLGYWIVLGGALLGNGTATYNTPRPGRREAGSVSVGDAVVIVFLGIVLLVVLGYVGR